MPLNQLEKAAKYSVTTGDRLMPLGGGWCEWERGGTILGLVRVTENLAKNAQEGIRVQPGLFGSDADDEMYRIKGDALRLPDGRVIKGKTQKGETVEPKKAPPSRETSHSSKYPPGSRWITVHPHGEDSHGIPVLIMPNGDGSASVIGGAGGKLNYLQLSRLRSPEDWQRDAVEKRKKRRQQQKEREASMSDEERIEEQKRKIYQQTAKQKNALETLQILQEAGISHGLTEEHLAALQAPGEDAPPEAMQERQRLANEAVKQARRIQQAYEHKLITDHEARAAAFLGDDPLGDVGNAVIENREHTAVRDGEVLSTIQHLADGRWLVRSRDDTQPDQVFEKWEDAAKAHVGNVQALEGGDRSQPDDFYNPKAWIRKHPEEQLPEGFTFRAEVAAQIAKLSAQRKEAEKNKRLGENSPPWTSGYDVQTKEVTEQEVLEQLDAAAETLTHAINNNNFLNLVDGLDAARLASHVRVGAFSQLSELSSDLLKVSGLPRALVETLGHNEAAKVLAYQVKQRSSPEDVKRAIAALESLHSHASVAETRAITEQVRPQLEVLKRLNDRLSELGGITDPSAEDLLEIDNLSYQSREIQAGIEKAVGTALGKYQAQAALIAALAGKSDTLRFTGSGNLANVSDLVPSVWGEEGEDEPAQDIFSAYGLEMADFELEESGSEQAIKILPSGVAKLAGQINLEDAALYERVQAIKRGEEDEENWLPAGFAYRPLETFGDAQDLADDFDIRLEIDPAGDDASILAALMQYAGDRVAAGDNPLRVRQDILSPDLYLQQQLPPQTADRALEIAHQLDRSLVSSATASDRAVLEGYRSLAAKVVSSRPDGQTLQDQTLIPEVAVEAAHRTLASMPLARTAFKPMGQLTGRERRFLREYAITEILGEELEERQPRGSPSEPEAEVVEVDIFGNIAPSQTRMDDQQDNQWQRFSRLMGGDRRAYDSIRDVLKGKFIERFAAAYGAIAGVKPIVGQQSYENVERLLIAQLEPGKREEMLSWLRSRTQSDYAKVRSRNQGRFSSEVDQAWLDRYMEIKGDNRQMSLFTTESMEAAPSRVQWQRPTLGETAEAQLEEMLRAVIPAFEQVNNPINLYPEENWGKGTQNAAKQRAIKLIKERKKFGVHFGAGSGKSSLMLGAFTELHREGAVKRALIAVPSAILSQFVGEAATFLEPGKYRVTANTNWPPEQRMDALKDESNHVYITTRESLASDILAIVQKHFNLGENEFQDATEDERRDWVNQALLKEGINPQDLMLAVDEAHDIARRRGVAPSMRSLVLDALTYHTPYYIHSTGTPFKNDLSEIFDFLQKVDPHKFSDRQAFLAQYGANTQATRRSLQRLLAPYSYAVSLRPTVKDAAGNIRHVKMRRTQPRLTLHPEQAKKRQEILRHYNTIRDFYSRRMGEIMTELRLGQRSSGPRAEDFADAWEDEAVRNAVEAIAAPSWHQKSTMEKSMAIGGQVMGAMGLKRTALWRLYHLSPYEQNPKMQYTVEQVQTYVQNNRPCVVFTSSQEAARMLKEQLDQRGIRTGLITGTGQSAQQRERERSAFSPSQGGVPETDVLICTDAAQTGLNLQRGKELIHYDVPLTQKAWNQRSARIFRRGQTEDVGVHTPLLDVPEEQIELARMRRKGQEGGLFQQRSELLDDTWLAGAIERDRLNQQAGAVSV